MYPFDKEIAAVRKHSLLTYMKTHRAAAGCSTKTIMPNKKISMARIKQVPRRYAAG